MLVTDGVSLLIGHATRSPRWDIPKGMAEPGEPPEATARRELGEETGLHTTAPLAALGQFRYLPRKNLAVFVWRVDRMPDPAQLVCRSMFTVAGHCYPEFDRFACLPWQDALERLGKTMRGLLADIATRQGWL